MRSKDITSEQFELAALRELSARLGANPLLVQASSGNSSVKIDDILWIKASGKWLIQPHSGDFLVPVRLSRARRYLNDNAAIPETVASSSDGVCASIETAMHAVLPYQVVLHVHSVNAIAWAVREDAPRQLAKRLAAHHWQWIPYSASGLALAKRIEQALSSRPQTDVFVLGNHGLVVCAHSCQAAEHLLAHVEKCLAIEPRPVPEPHPSLLKRALPGPEWNCPPSPAIHSLSTDSISRHILTRGVLYPCQAIFLAARASHSGAAQPLFQTVENHGVLCSQHMTQAQGQMLAGLADVIRRIGSSAPVRYLTDSELHDLSSAEVEAYRRVANTDSQVDLARRT